MSDLSIAKRLGLALDIMDLRGTIGGLAESGHSRPALELAKRRIHALRRQFMGKTAGGVDSLLSPSLGPDALAQALESAGAGGNTAAQVRDATHVSAIAGLMRKIDRAGGAQEASDKWMRLESDAAAMAAGPEKADAVIDGYILAGQFDPDIMARAAQAAESALQVTRGNASDIIAKHLPEVAQELSAHKAKVEDIGRARQDLRAKVMAAKEGEDSVEAIIAAKAEFEGAWDVYTSAMDEYRDAVSKATERLAELRVEAEAPCREIGRSVIDAITSASSITLEDATAWADKQQISKSAAARLRKMNYPVEQVRADMAEFYRLTGGRVMSVAVDSKGDRRANATEIHSAGRSAVINLGSSFDKRVLWHELAHHLESDPAALSASKRFIRRRAETGTPYTLRSLTGNKGYSSSEVAFKDHFFDPYVGKVYGEATEVFSMGIESFSDPLLLGLRLAQDPEMLTMIAGFIKEPVSDLARSYIELRDTLKEINEASQGGAEAYVEDTIKRLAGTVSFTASDDTSWAEDYQAHFDRMLSLTKGKQLGFLADTYVVEACRVYSMDWRSRRKVPGLIVYGRNDPRSQIIRIPTKDVDYARAAVAIFEKNGVWPSPADLFNEVSLKRNLQDSQT